MKPTILFVDDEPNVLSSFERLFRKDFAVVTANSGREALDKIAAATETFPVIISDMRMPEMAGDAFLAQARVVTPDSIRMVLTGETDIASAMKAVNEGAIFRFLLKPCSEALRSSIEAGVRQFELQNGERDLLEKTLSGCVKVLTEVLSLVNPTAFGRALRVRKYAHHVTTKLQMKDAWQVDVAAMLSQVGCVTLAPTTLEAIHTGRALSKEEEQRFLTHPSVARELLSQVPRLETVAKMIERQNEPYVPSDADDIVGQGSGILRVCLDFDQLVARGRTAEQALAELSSRTDQYNPAHVDALRDIGFDAMIYRPDVISIADLEATMVIDQDVRGTTRMLLVARGQEVNAALILRLKSLSQLGTIPDTVRVLALRPGFEGETPAPRATATA